MRLTFNEKQREKLADFAFGVAKGLLFGSVGFIAVGQTETKLLISFAGTFFAFMFVQIGLKFLEDD
ncbi:hypothetical protein HY085_01160 [Candidatus Gottesmanbacteria bacterium]|nr:hypothetical protein [Candidatus Gottesmanbacteria bacterium]